MTSIRVILWADSRIFRESLRVAIESSGEIRVVAEVASPVELLAKVDHEQADAVVMWGDSHEDLPGICSHLLFEFPRLIVLAVLRDSGRAVIYRQKLEKRPVSASNVHDLIDAVREADPSYWTIT